MSPEEYQRLTELFEAACDQSREGREAFLAEACAGDLALRARLDRMLAAEQRSTWLTKGAMDTDFDGRFGEKSVDLRVPERIGRYRVVRLLGEGGMGCAYEAEQESPRRRVAIKTIRAGLRTPQLLRRFEHEASILGRLRHPGIAQVYEAGVEQTAAGPSPFFVMELVHGPPLNEYLAVFKPDRARRLELFVAICEGVQHAHQHGVIHRDLKPANILIDGVGGDGAAAMATGSRAFATPTPKILDFGVARLTDPGEQLATIRTEAGMIIGTLAYMSPEQVSGDAATVDARTDVYSLGVILFEMLTGALPHDLQGVSIVNAARVIVERAAPRLSASDPSLRGDLETICAKAMAKDRERRYQTTSELAADIRRFMRHEPVMARPATVTYQLRRFARRNRGLVGAAGAALVAVVLGLVASTALYINAERNRAAAETARIRADHEAALSTGVREYLVKGLLKAAHPTRMGYDVKMMDVLFGASEGLHERFADNPEVEAEIRYELGDVLLSLGKFKESLEQYRLCIPLFEQTAGRDAAVTIRALLGAREAAAQQQHVGGALEYGRDALERAERSLPPEDRDRLAAMVGYANSLQAVARDAEASRLLRAAIAVFDRPGFRDGSGMVESALTALALCEHRAGRMQEWLALLRQSAAWTQGMYGPVHSESIGAASNLVVALNDLGKFEEAAALAEGLPALADRIHPAGSLGRAIPYTSAGKALRGVGRYAQAEPLLLKAHEIFVAVHADDYWVTDNSVSTLRKLYAEWPGHEQQLVTWCVESIRRALIASDAERFSARVLERVEGCRKQCEGVAGALDDAGFIDRLWEERDTLAPPGHRRRPAMLGNLARLMVAKRHTAHWAEAMELARAALADSSDRPGVEAILRAAQDEAPSAAVLPGPSDR